MLEKIELDSIDKNIIGILSKDATVPIQAIADSVGLSNNPCWRRIKRLEEVGVISGRVALINQAVLGLKTTVFVNIKINSHSTDWLTKFSISLDKIPEIIECHRMAGEVDYLLKVLVRDLSHYDEVYQSLIKYVPGITDVSSNFSMETLKTKGAVPLV